MRGLRLYLTPFAPDQSGAVSVLYEAGGMIVILDAGGCTGNICGFDEPRWMEKRSCVFSAGLRDMDAILGRDKLLVEKITKASKRIGASFISLIGTPVPSVIGTDYHALSHLLKRRVDLPILTVDTDGMELYDKGASKAYEEIFRVLQKEGLLKSADENKDSRDENKEKTVGILGETPLDLISQKDLGVMEEILAKDGYPRVLHYGMGANFDDMTEASCVDKNLVVSPAGLSAARFLKKQFGIEYTIAYPALKDALNRSLVSLYQEELRKQGASEDEITSMAGMELALSTKDKKILIVHQQVVAESYAGLHPEASVTTATWFMTDEEIGSHTIKLKEEDDFIKLVAKEDYDMIIADPVMKTMVPDYHNLWIPLPHFAVSGKYER